jgi:glycosyltransferase involved in cell wall biosynthesis
MSVKVSVIIPAFNAEATIRRALESALAQSYSNYEIIVVDDGSSDTTPQILSSYGARIVTTRQQNKGAAAARNRGAALATGELLAFLDADDEWHAQKLACQVAAFQRHPEISVCRTYYGNSDDFDWPLAALFTPEQIEAVPLDIISDFNRIFVEPYFGTPTVMIRAATFRQHAGFNETLRTAEDVDLWLRSSYGTRVAVVKAVLVQVHRKHSGLTATSSETIYANHLKVLETFCQNHPEYSQANRRTVRRAEAHVLRTWASSALVRRDGPQARQLLWQALRLNFSLEFVYLLFKSYIV